MFGFTRQNPATPSAVIDTVNVWPEDLTLRDLAEAADAAILANAEDARAGIDRAQRHRREGWTSVIVLGIALGGIAWAGATEAITLPLFGLAA